MPMKPCGVIVQGRDLVTYFMLEHESATAISLSLATYCRRVNRSIRIELFAVPDRLPDEGLTQATFDDWIATSRPIATLHRSLWTDNEPTILHLDAHHVVPHRRYALRIGSDEPGSGVSVSPWLHAGPARIAGHIRTFYRGEDQGDYGLMAELHFHDTHAGSQVPSSLLYSPVTQCNLNCIHCISRESRVAKAVLCPTIKAQISEWCERGLIHEIASDYSGDILWADHRFGGELAFLKSLDVPLHIDTNGAYLSEDAAHALIDMRLHSLNISLDAATEESYRRVRRGAPPLAQVMDNIARFSRLRDEAGARERIALSVSFTLMRSTLDELDDFIRHAARMGVETVHGRHLEAYTADMGTDSLVFDQARLDAALDRAYRVAEDHNVVLATARLPTTYGGRGHRHCQVPWGSATILGNGDVAVCCVPRMTIGNLHETSMEDLWNGPRYQELRRRVNSTTPPPQCAACPIMRTETNLNSYMPFLTMNDWQHPKDWLI